MSLSSRHFSSSPARALLALVSLLAAGSVTTASEVFDLGAYRGKVVVLDFWASWCVPCRRSFPWLNEMQDKYGDDGLVIIGVNVDADPEEARAFLDQFPADFEIVYDAKGELAERYGIIAMPSSYVFDRHGVQVTRHLGFKVRRQLEYETLLIETLAN
jgi:thiol-disulfide isomerase/thioredoxin